MGREIRRVPLDFAWPIDMVWKGFLSPYSSQKCKPRATVRDITPRRRRSPTTGTTSRALAGAGVPRSRKTRCRRS
jgi:hypothetical protein